MLFMRLAFTVLLSGIFFCAQAQNVAPASIYDFKVPALKGGTIDLSQYKGKKILIVNTPSENDRSRGYAEIEALYQQYKDKLVIIGFLDDDFGPRPGSKKSATLANKQYNVSFPLTTKIFVKGPQICPVYQWLSSKQANHFKDTEVSWDFNKFLINEQGQLVAYFDQETPANDPEVIAAITK